MHFSNAELSHGFCEAITFFSMRAMELVMMSAVRIVGVMTTAVIIRCSSITNSRTMQ
jgi:hypothetical protein